MFYFKFTDTNGNEMYGSVSADKEKLDLEKLKNLLLTETLEEVSKEEYAAQDAE